MPEQQRAVAGVGAAANGQVIGVAAAGEDAGVCTDLIDHERAEMEVGGGTRG